MPLRRWLGLAYPIPCIRQGDPEPVNASLRGNRFDTVLGDIGFDGKGDVTAPGYVWKGGTYDHAK